METARGDTRRKIELGSELDGGTTNFTEEMVEASNSPVKYNEISKLKSSEAWKPTGIQNPLIFTHEERS